MNNMTKCIDIWSNKPFASPRPSILTFFQDIPLYVHIARNALSTDCLILVKLGIMTHLHPNTRDFVFQLHICINGSVNILLFFGLRFASSRGRGTDRGRFFFFICPSSGPHGQRDFFLKSLCNSQRPLSADHGRTRYSQRLPD